MEGVVVTLKRDRGFGFIRSPGMPDIFFHAKALDVSLAFDEQLIERRVRFNVQPSHQGPRAMNVRPVD